MNFDNYLFRCSSLGSLMTGSKVKGQLGETCKKYLHQCYIEQVYGRTNEVSSKFMEKGTLVEESSITLLSEVDKTLLIKYKGAPLKNAYIKGTPDIKKGKDIKSSWDIYTFFNAQLTKDNELQAIGYMELTGEQEWEIDYCLVNTPEHIIEREIRSLFFKMGVESEDNPDYQMAKIELIKNSTFDDIPKEKRVKKFLVKRDQTKVDALYLQVTEARKYLNELYKQNK